MDDMHKMGHMDVVSWDMDMVMEGHGHGHGRGNNIWTPHVDRVNAWTWRMVMLMVHGDADAMDTLDKGMGMGISRAWACTMT